MKFEIRVCNILQYINFPFYAAAYRVNPLDLSPQYASILTGVTRLGQFGGSISTTLAGALREKVCLGVLLNAIVWGHVKDYYKTLLFISNFFYQSYLIYLYKFSSFSSECGILAKDFNNHGISSSICCCHIHYFWIGKRAEMGPIRVWTDNFKRFSETQLRIHYNFLVFKSIFIERRVYKRQTILNWCHHHQTLEQHKLFI